MPRDGSLAGVSDRDLQEAVQLLGEVRSLQAAQTAAARPTIIRALMTSHQIPFVPPASLAQAQRVAVRRDALLASGVETHESVAGRLGHTLVSTTRTWISRKRAAQEIFTVGYEGRTLIPTFQLQESGQPRPELQPILRVLSERAVDPWSQWTWLTTASSFLSGEVPERVARTNPARALRAAERFAAPRRS